MLGWFDWCCRYCQNAGSLPFLKLSIWIFSVIVGAFVVHLHSIRLIVYYVHIVPFFLNFFSFSSIDLLLLSTPHHPSAIKCVYLKNKRIWIIVWAWICLRFLPKNQRITWVFKSKNQRNREIWYWMSWNRSTCTQVPPEKNRSSMIAVTELFLLCEQPTNQLQHLLTWLLCFQLCF